MYVQKYLKYLSKTIQYGGGDKFNKSMMDLDKQLHLQNEYNIFLQLYQYLIRLLNVESAGKIVYTDDTYILNTLKTITYDEQNVQYKIYIDKIIDKMINDNPIVYQNKQVLTCNQPIKNQIECEMNNIKYICMQNESKDNYDYYKLIDNSWIKMNKQDLQLLTDIEYKKIYYCIEQ